MAVQVNGMAADLAGVYQELLAVTQARLEAELKLEELRRREAALGAEFERAFMHAKKSIEAAGQDRPEAATCEDDGCYAPKSLR